MRTGKALGPIRDTRQLQPHVRSGNGGYRVTPRTTRIMDLWDKWGHLLEEGDIEASRAILALIGKEYQGRFGRVALKEDQDNE